MTVSKRYHSYLSPSLHAPVLLFSLGAYLELRHLASTVSRLFVYTDVLSVSQGMISVLSAVDNRDKPRRPCRFPQPPYLRATSALR
jgi:hypothetical protein